MALSSSGLATRIKTKLAATFPTVTDAAWQDAFCAAVAEAVVEEIHANATITGAGTVTSGAGSGGTISVASGAVS